MKSAQHIPRWLVLAALFAGIVKPVDAAARASAYERREIEQWSVYVHPALIETNPAVTERALELLRKQLEEIVRVVPPAAVKELQWVPLYLSPESPGQRFGRRG